MSRKGRSVVSAVYDGEADDASGSGWSEDRVARELGDFHRLSRLLRVPARVGREDPFFVTRFRQRRDELRRRLRGMPPWRRVALRLVPVAVSAVLAAVSVLTLSNRDSDALGELEMRAFGRGVTDVRVESAEVEPVLRIALGEL